MASLAWAQSENDYTRDRPSPGMPGYELKDPPPVDTPPGVLTYVSGVRWAFGYNVAVDEPNRFQRARPGCGTTSPQARVCTIRLDPLDLAVAVDARDPKSLHFDLLRLDLTGKGDFHGAPVVPRNLMRADRSTRTFSYEFEDYPLMLTVAGREVPVFLKAVYAETEGPRGGPAKASLRLRLQTFAQGACPFGDKVHNVRVVDGTGNLRLTDTTRPAGGTVYARDTVIVDIGTGDFKRTLSVPYGGPVLVDGRLFQVTVSEADMKVAASPYEGPTGFLRVGKPFWTAYLRTGETGFEVCGGAEPVPPPPGTYKFLLFSEWPSADLSGPLNYLELFAGWQDTADFPSSSAPPFNIVAAKTTDVAIGSPIQAGLTVKKESGAVVFHLEAKDASGCFRPRVRHSADMYWDQENPHTIDIKDANDRVVARCEIKWEEENLAGRWPIPSDARGRYTAVLHFAAGPFKVQTTPVSFTVP
jgi:hypothetical protein